MENNTNIYYTVVTEAGVFVSKEYKEDGDYIVLPTAFEQVQRVQGVFKDFKINKNRILAIGKTESALSFDELYNFHKTNLEKAFEILKTSLGGEVGGNAIQ